jgi:hypothetical protein
MTQPNSWYGVPPKLAHGQESPVAGDDLLLIIDQEGTLKPNDSML